MLHPLLPIHPTIRRTVWCWEEAGTVARLENAVLEVSEIYVRWVWVLYCWLPCGSLGKIISSRQTFFFFSPVSARLQVLGLLRVGLCSWSSKENRKLEVGIGGEGAGDGLEVRRCHSPPPKISSTDFHSQQQPFSNEILIL